MLEETNIKIPRTVSEINGQRVPCQLEYILTGKTFDESAYEECIRKNDQPSFQSHNE